MRRVRLNESQLRRLVRSVINEEVAQIARLPKDLYPVFMKRRDFQNYAHKKLGMNSDSQNHEDTNRHIAQAIKNGDHDADIVAFIKLDPASQLGKAFRSASEVEAEEIMERARKAFVKLADAYDQSKFSDSQHPYAQGYAPPSGSRAKTEYSPSSRSSAPTPNTRRDLGRFSDPDATSADVAPYHNVRY